MKTLDRKPERFRREKDRGDAFIEDTSWREATGTANTLELLPAAFLNHFRTAMKRSDERTPTALIYCRVSSPRSNGESIETQLERCRAHMLELGAVTASDNSVFIDHGRSGTTTRRRAGLSDLLAQVEAQRPDYVICSTSCRIARNLGDFAHIWDLFDFYHVELHEAGTGVVRRSDVPIIGFQAAEERKRFIEASIEGTWLSAAAGDLIGRARTYGYELATNGPLRLVRHPEQADIVLRIFQDFNERAELLPLCRRLNLDGIETKYGKRWSRTILLGPGRHCGILNNILYRGSYVVGRVAKSQPPEWLQLPRTTDGRILPIHFHIPELAIVPVDLFDSVQIKLIAMKRAAETGRTDRVRPPAIPNLLTGLVRCGCGSAMSYKPCRNGETLFCVGSLSGVSDHAVYAPSADVEREVLRIVRDNAPGDVGHKAALASNSKSYRPSHGRAAALRRRIGIVEQNLENSLDIAPGTPAARGAEARRARWERELETLEADLEDASAQVDREAVTTVPSPRASIDRMLENVPFKAVDPQAMRARDAVRRRLSRIVVASKGDGKGFDLVVHLLNGSPDDPLAVLRIARAATTKRLGFAAEEELLVRLRKAAESGVLDLDDAAWSIVSPLFDRLRGNKFDCRLAADAAIFVALTGLPLTLVPSRFGTRNQLASRIPLIGRSGIWRAMVARLREIGHPRSDELDPGSFEPVPQKKRSTRGRSNIQRAYGLLQSLACGEDDVDLDGDRGPVRKCAPFDRHVTGDPLSRNARRTRTRRDMGSHARTAAQRRRVDERGHG